MPGGSQGFVAGQDSLRHWSEDNIERSGAVFFPRASVLADRDDRNGLPVDEDGVAAACVIGSVGGHRADVFAFRDLDQQGLLSAAQRGIVRNRPAEGGWQPYRWFV